MQKFYDKKQLATSMRIHFDTLFEEKAFFLPSKVPQSKQADRKASHDFSCIALKAIRVHFVC